MSTGSQSPSLCPRPSTSQGTQRLYIRLNTLYYIHSHINSLGKSLALFLRNNNGAPTGPSLPRPASNTNRCLATAHHFDSTHSIVQSAVHHVSEVAAHRLIFLDSNRSFYNGLYIGDTESSRIQPVLRILKQNLSLLVTILTDQAQPGTAKEVMKASFEAFLMVLLAGGSDRRFAKSDHDIVLEDFWSLKRVFCTSGEGLVAEEIADKEAEVVEDIVALMGLPTERLIKEFIIAASGSSGVGAEQGVLPMPPTTGRWNRGDPNTVLRVLCHRNDDAASHFLKKAFQLPKRS